YSPTVTTLEGEPRGIWPFLGTDRLAAPIAEHRPDVVLHGHTHAGRFEGAIGDVPVFNVAVPVLGRDFFVLSWTARRYAPPPDRSPERGGVRDASVGHARGVGQPRRLLRLAPAF